MLPKANLTIQQGATWRLPIEWTSEDTPPVPFDLTGYTARMKIRKDNYQGRVLLELTSENDRIIFTDAEAGEFELSISAADTAALMIGCHVYDLELVDGDDVKRILQGEVKVDPEVTR